jgi:hypothetical protein
MSGRWYSVAWTTYSHNADPLSLVTDFTKNRKSKINRKCYRKCDFQAFD